MFWQSHALVLKDVDGDDRRDLITGKRYLAHHDGYKPGFYEPAGYIGMNMTGQKAAMDAAPDRQQLWYR